MKKILLAVLAATLLAGAAFADTYTPVTVSATVNVWNGNMTSLQQQAISTTPSFGPTQTWTFTYTGQIDFVNNCAQGSSSTCNTISNFGFNSGNVSGISGSTDLTTFLATVMSMPNSGGDTGPGTASYLVFTFNYSSTAAGQLSHDDGASFYGPGGTLVSSPTLTSEITNSFNYNGNGQYQLVYVEANGSPSDLILTSTPEPASLLLLGSGLLGLAGLTRRKLIR